MNLAQDSVKVFVAKIITSLATFSAVVVFSRGLGADPLGIYYPFVALLGILSLPTDFGVSLAVEKRISEGDDRGQYLGAGALMRLFLLVIFSIPIYFFQNEIANYIGSSIGTILIVALWLEVSAKFSISILKGELRVGETAIIRVLHPILWLTVGYVLLSIGYGIEAIIYSHVIGRLAIVVVATWRISVWPAIPNRSHIQSLFDFSKFSFVTSVGGLIYSWMDVLILTAYVSLEIVGTRAQIGAYENAWRVSLLATFVSRSIAQVLFPQVSQWHAQNKMDKIEQVLTKAIIPGLVIIPPAILGVIILSEEILIHLFGSEFAVASSVLIILMILRLFDAIDGLYFQIIDALDRPDLTMISTVVAVIINIILNIILIYQLGIIGAAISTLSAVIIKTGIDSHYLSKFIKIRLPYKIMIWSLISSIIMGANLFWITTRIEINSLITLCLLIGLGIAIYSIILCMYRPIRDFIFEITNSITSSVYT